jgi:hypothetical protein
MEGSIDPLIGPMASAYVPFPNLSIAGAGAPRKKIEYGTGIVVSAAGHVVADRRLTQGCNVIALPGLGNAERIAAESDGDLALLRIYGAQTNPMGLIGSPAPGPDVTLVGVADPQSQGGGNAVTSVKARIDATAPDSPLETPPAIGFSGAAALDAQGHFAGMVVMKPSLVAGPNGAPQAAVVPAARIKDFLLANYVTLASGKPGVDEAKSAVTRVICVRQ